MPWIAPPVDRQGPPYVATGEREMLETWLEFHRQGLLWKCSGLTPDQLRQQAVEPSRLSLLGLLRHMAEVERIWFRRYLAGEEIGPLYRTEAEPGAEFGHLDTADAEQAMATYVQEVELARAAARERSLEATFFYPRRGVELSLRWIYVHVIGEYARHNGHADLLRERIDGATGL